MKRTISAMVGKGSVTHNSRSFTAENVDSERTHLNIDYCNEPIKKVYHELFDEALKQYNDKQKRKDRKISDYYKHIESGKQEKLFHEVIFQIGNKEDMSATGEYAELARAILDEYYQGFQERNSQLTFIWTKLRRISISTLCRSQPGASADWKRGYLSKRLCFIKALKEKAETTTN